MGATLGNMNPKNIQRKNSNFLVGTLTPKLQQQMTPPKQTNKMGLTKIIQQTKPLQLEQNHNNHRGISNNQKTKIK